MHLIALLIVLTCAYAATRAYLRDAKNTGNWLLLGALLAPFLLLLGGR